MYRRQFFSAGCAAIIGFPFFNPLLKKITKDLPPFCGVKDAASGPFKRKSSWSKHHLTYYMHSRDSGELSSEIWDHEFKLAFDAWSEVTPLTFSKGDSTKTSDIIIAVGGRKREGFGRVGGTLAWAQLPPSKDYDGQLLTKFDLAEDWVLPGGDHGVILRSVACHEIGHLLGLDHSSDQDALMYPYINDALKPRMDDIQKIQKLYGPRA